MTNKMSKKPTATHKKAWDVFSLWIRRVRDCETCYTCGARNTQMNAGHFWHAVLDFDEENIHCQCVQCNKWNHGNLSQYSANLLNQLGPEKFKALELRHYVAMRGEYRTTQDYQDIIDKYTAKIKEYEAKKGIKIL